MDSDLYLLAWSKLQDAAFLWLSDVPPSVSAREELQGLMQRLSPSELAAWRQAEASAERQSACAEVH